MPEERVIFRWHAVRQMLERKITEVEVREVLETGQVIEEYPDRLPTPARLVLGWVDGNPIHVVSSRVDGATIVVVTVYRPNAAEWELGFRRRRRP